MDSVASAGAATAVPPPAAGAIKGRPDPEKLRLVAGEFEAFFITQMLGSMRRGMPENPFFGQGPGTRTFQEMLDQEYGKQASRGGSRLGIADLLLRRFNPPPAPEPAGTHVDATR